SRVSFAALCSAYFQLALSSALAELHPCPTRRSSDLAHGDGAGPQQLAHGGRHLDVAAHRDFHHLDGRRDGALVGRRAAGQRQQGDRKSTRLNSSHVKTSYAVFCFKYTTLMDLKAMDQ